MTMTLRDALYVGLFWLFITALACMAIWEFIASLAHWSGNQPAKEEDREPSEWDKLSEEEQEYLKRFFK